MRQATYKITIKLQTTFPSKNKTKNIDGAVRSPNNTDFNCIQAQFSSIELRGVTLEREDGWLTTNFDAAITSLVVLIII